MTGWLLVAGLAIILLFPETPTASALRRWLIDEPARLLSETTPRKLARAIVISLVLIIVACAAPEFLALMLSFGDVGLAIELFGALALLSFNQKVVGALKRILRAANDAAAAVCEVILATRPRGRERRRRARRGKRPPGDDARPPAWAEFAFP
jgi:hypothetical protein